MTEERGVLEAPPATGEQPPPEPHGPTGWYVGLPRRARVGLWLAFTVWLGLGALVVTNWSGVGGERPAQAPVVVPEPELVLLVAEGPGDVRPAMALVHGGTDASTVVLLPPGTLVEVPGMGPRHLHDALRQGGPQGLVTSVANALGVRVPLLLHGAPDAVAATVEAVGGATVDVGATIEVEDDGILRQLYAQGPQLMDGQGFLSFLVTPLVRESELQRLTRQDAAWRGLLRQLASSPAPDTTFDGWTGDLDPPTALAVMRSVAASANLQFLTLPVTPQPISGESLYRIQTSELGAVWGRLGSARSPRPEQGQRLRLLVGAEGPVGPAVARLLLEEGYRIEITGMASEPYDSSRVVIPVDERPALQPHAQRLLALLGTGRMAYERHNSSRFDATVVVGKDWAEANGFPQPAAGSR